MCCMVSVCGFEWTIEMPKGLEVVFMGDISVKMINVPYTQWPPQHAKENKYSKQYNFKCLVVIFYIQDWMGKKGLGLSLAFF